MIEEEELFLVKIAALLVCTRWVVKMMEHLSFCIKLRIFCIKGRAAVDHVV